MADDTARRTNAEDRAIEAVTRNLLTGRGVLGAPLRVTFPAAGTRRDVAHGLGVIPDGYEIVFADATIHAASGVLWTPTLAYLQADANNAHAIVRFYTLREDPTDA